MIPYICVVLKRSHIVSVEKFPKNVGG